VKPDTVFSLPDAVRMRRESDRLVNADNKLKPGEWYHASKPGKIHNLHGTTTVLKAVKS